MTVSKVSSLPPGWALTDLQTVSQVNPTLDKSAYADTLPVSFVPMPAVEAETGVMDVSLTRPFGEVKKGFTPFQRGDVLFAKITPCMENGKMAVVPPVNNGLGFGSTEFHVLRPYDGVEARYIYYFVSSQTFRRAAERKMTGAVGQRRVPTTYIEAHPLPLPPSSEQKRIVDKLDELLSDLDKGRDSLQAARSQLQGYREAVLASAFTGKLTQRWRHECGSRLAASAEILAGIKRHRAALQDARLKAWHVAVNAWQNSGSVGRKPQKPSALREIGLPTKREAERLPVLPKGWLWMKVGDFLVDSPANGHSVKDRASGFPVLRLNALRGGKIDLLQKKNGDWERDQALPYLVAEGDFMVARGNGSKSLVGRGGLIPPVTDEVAYPDTMIRLRIDYELVNPVFFANAWDSRVLRRQVEATARTTAGIYKINQGHILNYIIPLCSRMEQDEIARLVEEKLSLCNQMLNEIDSRLTQADALRCSVLNSAFSGRLVKQDPGDEPASTLLQRIAARKKASADAAKANKPLRKRTNAA